jgi:hypothetical protein
MSDQHLSKQRALNDKFFADIDRQLLAELREDLEADSRVEALSAATGIADAGLLAELVEMDLQPETLAAFRMVPLLMVAWSDRILQKEEQAKLLEIAGRHGIEAGTASFRLLNEWLQREPPAPLFEAWKDYVEELCEVLTPTAVASLRQEVITQAEAVAEAAGGFLGFGATNKEEQQAIQEVRSAFPAS